MSQAPSFSLAAKLFVCAASLSVATLGSAPALAGERDVQEALVLVEANQERARAIGQMHIDVITATRIEIWKGVPTSYEPGAREADLFMNLGGEMTRRAVAQLEVIRKIVRAEKESADPKVAAGATQVGILADAHEEYLNKAVESAAKHLSFENMGAEMKELEVAYQGRLAAAPSWVLALRGKTKEKDLVSYEGDITSAAARVTLDTRPGRSGPTGLPGRGGGGAGPANVMSNEEYQKRKQALEAKKAADKKHFDQRMAELAEHEKQKAAAEQARLERARQAAAVPPPPPPELPVVQAWHKTFYSVEIVPFKQALGGVVGLPERSRDTSGVCSRLTVVSRGLLADKRLASGTPAVDEPLRAALKSFSQAGQACLEGRMGDLKTGLSAGEASLGRFAAALGTYQLRP